MGTANGLGEEAGDRHDLELVTHLPFQGDGVADEHPLDDALVDAVDGRSREDPVGGHDPDRQGPAVHDELGGFHDGPARSNFVIHDDRVQATDIPDEVGGRRLVVVAVAAFVHDRDWKLQTIGEFANVLCFSHIAGDQHTTFQLPLLLHVLAERRRSHQVIGRDAEETLDLRGMQVHHHHSIGASCMQEIGHQARRDRDPGLVLLVGASIEVVGHDDRDPIRRRVFEGVDSDEHFHNAVADRRGHGLDVEDITAADIFADLDHQILVAEAHRLARSELEIQMTADVLSEMGVAATGDDANVAVHGVSSL